MKIGKINVDFQVLETKDPKIFSIADTSNWGSITTKKSIIEITLPAEVNKVVHYFNKQSINIFNSGNLNLNCPTGDCHEVDLVDLPDGIYTITVKGSPDSFQQTRTYLRTTLTQLELDKLFINNMENDSLLEKITNIDLLLNAAEANVRLNNISKAQELLFLVHELIKESKNCIGCINT